MAIFGGISEKRPMNPTKLKKKPKKTWKHVIQHEILVTFRNPKLPEMLKFYSQQHLFHKEKELQYLSKSHFLVLNCKTI